MIFFDWQRSWDGDFEDIQIGNGVIDHIGIVERVEGNVVYTIEGNTSDMCAKRSYLLTSTYIVGYGTPDYPDFEGEPAIFEPGNPESGEGLDTQ